jgi:hypothetical protein
VFVTAFLFLSQRLALLRYFPHIVSLIVSI